MNGKGYRPLSAEYLRCTVTGRKVLARRNGLRRYRRDWTRIEETRAVIRGLHFLLTYGCTYECDHCFLHCSPRSGGTFTLAQIEAVLHEAAGLKSVKSVSFEGGEPFLYYPLLLAGVRKAAAMGFNIEVVTNGYFAVSEEDALMWLEPLAKAGVTKISISDDIYHNPGGVEPSPAHLAIRAAQKLPVSLSVLSTAAPAKMGAVFGKEDEDPLMFRGRAVENLAGQALSLPAGFFNECPYEDLVNPGRVHLDAFGNVHICQGLVLGNMWERALSEVLTDYRAEDHPVCGPLAQGGPLRLAETYGLPSAPGYADACHFCYCMRLALLERFPRYLAPRLVYGLE